MSYVIVLTGGISDEREVALRSGAAVADALKNLGHKVKVIDYDGKIASYRDELLKADVVFPALHGKGGEDGTLQAELEKLNICYVGPDAKSSALCMDKWLYKMQIQDELPTPKGELVDDDTFWESDLTEKPFVLKPNDGGSSVDTFIVTNPSKVDVVQIADAFTRNPEMLLEELINGIEITVGVLGDQALPVCEIIPPSDGGFDYANKYNGKTQELCPPRNIPAKVQKLMQQYALKAHQLCGCRDLSRTDMFMTPDEKIYVIETNTLPGMTNQSLYPKEAAAAGIKFDDLVEQLVQMALKHK